jgi:hypothetical protein
MPLWSQNTVNITLPVDLTHLNIFDHGELGRFCSMLAHFCLQGIVVNPCRLLWQCTQEILDQWYNITTKMTEHKHLNSYGHTVLLAHNVHTLLHPKSWMIMTTVLCNRFKSCYNSLSVSLLFLHITFSMSKQLSAFLAVMGLPLFIILCTDCSILEFCTPFHYTVLTHNIFTLNIHELAVIFCQLHISCIESHQVTAWTPFCSSQEAMFSYLYSQYTVDGAINNLCCVTSSD